MRTSFRTTYNEIKAAYTFSEPVMSPDPMVVEYTERNGRREGLLYNNRIMSGMKSYSAQYDINRTWILTNFKK